MHEGKVIPRDLTHLPLRYTLHFRFRFERMGVESNYSSLDNICQKLEGHKGEHDGIRRPLLVHVQYSRADAL